MPQSVAKVMSEKSKKCRANDGMVTAVSFDDKAEVDRLCKNQ
jgi:hypothetical protein